MGVAIMGQEWDANGNQITAATAVPAKEWDANGNPVGAAPSSTVAPPPQDGFLKSLATTFGIDPSAPPSISPKDLALKAVLGPVGQVASAIYQGGKRTVGELVQAHQASVAGNQALRLQHLVTAIPLLGPILDKGSDQYAAGNYSGEAGTLLGGAAQMAPLALGALDTAVPGRPVLQIPSQARAGATLQSVNQNLANQPVTLTQSAAPLQRTVEVGVRGSTLPKSVSDLLQRSQSPSPMTFPEARDYQSSLSDLSTSDKLAMNNRMRGNVAQLNKALYQDMLDAATQGGQGSEFAQGMKEYRQASQLRSAIKTGVKYGVPAVVGGGLASKFLTQLTVGK